MTIISFNYAFRKKFLPKFHWTSEILNVVLIVTFAKVKDNNKKKKKTTFGFELIQLLKSPGSLAVEGWLTWAYDNNNKWKEAKVKKKKSVNLFLKHVTFSLECIHNFFQGINTVL